jgi:hypothetical protein
VLLGVDEVTQGCQVRTIGRLDLVGEERVERVAETGCVQAWHVLHIVSIVLD